MDPEERLYKTPNSSPMFTNLDGGTADKLECHNINDRVSFDNAEKLKYQTQSYTENSGEDSFTLLNSEVNSSQGITESLEDIINKCETRDSSASCKCSKKQEFNVNSVYGTKDINTASNNIEIPQKNIFPVQEISAAIRDILQSYMYSAKDVADILKNLTASKDHDENEKNKPLLNSIRQLNSEKRELENANHSLKYLNTTLESENRELTEKYNNVRTAILDLYRDLEKHKYFTTAPSLFSSIFYGRLKPEEDNTINYLKQLKDYIKKLHEIEDKQNGVIKYNNEENHKLVIQLGNAKTTISNLNKALEENRKDQEEMLQNEEKKFTELKKKFETTEFGYKKIIREKNIIIETQKEKYQSESIKMQKHHLAQVDLIQKMKQEKKDLEEKAKNEKGALEKSLDQSRIELKNIKDQLQYFNSEWNKEFILREDLENKLKHIKTAIENQENYFAIEKDKFKNSFDEISKNVEIYTKQISLEEMKRKSENKTIDEAITKIREITIDIQTYENQIKEFQGNSKDKKYLDIREKLIRAIEKLDVIESQKRKTIQMKRKDAINYIKCLQELLETRVNRK